MFALIFFIGRFYATSESKKASTVYAHQLGKPIRRPYLEQNLDPYALRLVKFVYKVHLGAYCTETTQQKSACRYANAKIAVLG